MSGLRRTLDWIYLVSGYVSATFLLGILMAVMWQVGARWMGVAVDGTEAAGMCLAATTFFGLAYTFRAGAHVRINLIVGHLRPALQRPVEIFNCAVGLIVAGYLSWSMWLLTMQSWEFHDVSPGLLAMPFWIPQLGVATGLTILVIALLDELLWILRGGKPRYDETANDAPVA